MSVKYLTLDARAFETVEERMGYYHRERVKSIDDGDPINLTPGGLFVIHVLPQGFTDEMPLDSSNRPGYEELPIYRRGRAHDRLGTATGIGSRGPSIGDDDALAFRCFTHLTWTGAMEIAVSLDSPEGDREISGVLYEAGVVAMVGQTIDLLREYGVPGPYRIEGTLQNLIDFEVVYSVGQGPSRRVQLGIEQIAPFGLTVSEKVDDLRSELASLIDALWHVAGLDSPYLRDGKWTAASYVEDFE